MLLNFMIKSLSSEVFIYSVSKLRGSENGKVRVFGIVVVCVTPYLC